MLASSKTEVLDSEIADQKQSAVLTEPFRMKKMPKKKQEVSDRIWLKRS